jgi:hypothetical protein
MNLSRKAFRKFGILFFALSATLSWFQRRCDAAVQQSGEQQSQQQQQQSPPPPPTNSSAPAPPANPDQPAVKQKKVWTNDDVVGLRTPADTYQVEKEQKEAADAAAAAKEAAIRAAAKSDKEITPDVKLPATAEETQTMIKDTEGEIAEGTVVLDKMRTELQNASEEQKTDKQKQIDRVTANVEKQRTNLKALQDHLQALNQKREADAQTPPPPSL